MNAKAIIFYDKFKLYSYEAGSEYKVLDESERAYAVKNARMLEDLVGAKPRWTAPSLRLMLGGWSLVGAGSSTHYPDNRPISNRYVAIHVDVPKAHCIPRVLRDIRDTLDNKLARHKKQFAEYNFLTDTIFVAAPTLPPEFINSKGGIIIYIACEANKSVPSSHWRGGVQKMQDTFKTQMATLEVFANEATIESVLACADVLLAHKKREYWASCPRPSCLPRAYLEDASAAVQHRSSALHKVYQNREAFLKDKGYACKAAMQVFNKPASSGELSDLGGVIDLVSIMEKLSVSGCLVSNRFTIITVDMYTGDRTPEFLESFVSRFSLALEVLQNSNKSADTRNSSGDYDFISNDKCRAAPDPYEGGFRIYIPCVYPGDPADVRWQAATMKDLQANFVVQKGVLEQLACDSVKEALELSKPLSSPATALSTASVGACSNPALPQTVLK